jgi:hypothetical protein
MTGDRVGHLVTQQFLRFYYLNTKKAQSSKRFVRDLKVS